MFQPCVTSVSPLCYNGSALCYKCFSPLLQVFQPRITGFLIPVLQVLQPRVTGVTTPCNRVFSPMLNSCIPVFHPRVVLVARMTSECFTSLLLELQSCLTRCYVTWPFIRRTFHRIAKQHLCIGVIGPSPTWGVDQVAAVYSGVWELVSK